jgi:hypothetical protein
MQMLLLRTIVAAIVIGIVSEISHRSPKIGAVVLALPVVSILALLMTWFRDHDLKPLQQLSRETLILVPLSLPFFVPLAFAERLGLSFWPALGQEHFCLLSPLDRGSCSDYQLIDILDQHFSCCFFLLSLSMRLPCLRTTLFCDLEQQLMTKATPACPQHFNFSATECHRPLATRTPHPKPPIHPQ